MARNNTLKIIYLTAGSAMLIFFLWTGRYLRTTYPDKSQMDMGFRVMLRSRHIFLLLMSFVQLGIGVYIQPAFNRILRFAQYGATLLLLLADYLFVYSFFFEVDVKTIPQTPLLHQATYISLAAVLLHVLVIFDTNEQ